MNTTYIILVEEKVFREYSVESDNTNAARNSKDKWKLISALPVSSEVLNIREARADE